MTTQYAHLSKEDLERIIHFNPETGAFTWLQTRGKRKKGEVGGTLHSNGYIALEISGTRVFAHRLAWFMYYGKWPANQIDHINGVKNDNRIENLRDVTQSQNQWNIGLRKDNSSGIRGVNFHKHRNKWAVEGRKNGKRTCIGYFNNKEDAKEARIQWEIANHSEFRSQHHANN